MITDVRERCSYNRFKVLIIIMIISFSSSLLKAQVIEIDTVFIIAKPRISKLTEQPLTEPLSILPATSVVSRNEIRLQGANTVIDALNHVPGGLTETRGRQVKQFFSVRGQKYPYPDYAINGVWQKEFEELPYFFSASDIEEIEIIRSSAALLTGLSGLSGLINIKTREYQSSETVLEAEYGTFNTAHLHLSTGNTIGRLSYAAGGGYDRTEGPKGMHANESMANLYARMTWQPVSSIILKANIFGLDGTREMAIALEPAEPRYRNMRQSFDPYRALLSNVRIEYRPGNNLTSELQLFYSRRNPTFIDEVRETESNEKDYEYGVNFLQAVALSSSNVLRFGGLYNRWVAPNGKRFYIGKRCDTETFSAVIADEQQLGRFTFDTGIRFTGTYLNEYAAYNIEGDGGLFRDVTPVTDEWEAPVIQATLGASFDYSRNLSFHVNSAAGQVKPRVGTLSTSMTEPENETRLKIDIGSIYKTELGKYSLTAFGVFQKNAIVLSGTTATSIETGEVRVLYLNRNQSQTGIEFEALPPPVMNTLRPFFNFTLIRSRMENDNQMVANREHPALITSGGLYFRQKAFDINILCKYVAPFENDRFVPAYHGPQPLGDFFVADINGGYTTKGKVPVRLYFRVRNLSDLRYSTVNGYPDFGRMLYAGVQVKLMKEAD
ncbi:MAG: TonB-dependent receptor plug domain-containing protein [Bacteroidales bacterium]|nr:TonB-dependent receptor plug domain-containing protein [Bacteroidales bacterium]